MPKLEQDLEPELYLEATPKQMPKLKIKLKLRLKLNLKPKPKPNLDLTQMRKLKLRLKPKQQLSSSQCLSMPPPQPPYHPQGGVIGIVWQFCGGLSSVAALAIIPHAQQPLRP